MSEPKQRDSKLESLRSSKHDRLGDNYSPMASQRILITVLICLIIIITGFSFEAYLHQHLLFNWMESDCCRSEAAIAVSISFGLLLAGTFLLQLSRVLLRHNNFIWQGITIALFTFGVVIAGIAELIIFKNYQWQLNSYLKNFGLVLLFVSLLLKETVEILGKTNVLTIYQSNQKTIGNILTLMTGFGTIIWLIFT